MSVPSGCTPKENVIIVGINASGMKQKVIELLIALPAIVGLGYHGGMYMVNVLIVGVLPYLGRYLWKNNPFK